MNIYSMKNLIVEIYLKWNLCNFFIASTLVQLPAFPLRTILDNNLLLGFLIPLKVCSPHKVNTVHLKMSFILCHNPDQNLLIASHYLLTNESWHWPLGYSLTSSLTFYISVTLFQPHWFPCCSSSTINKSMFLYQELCIWSFRLLNCSSPR